VQYTIYIYICIQVLLLCQNFGPEIKDVTSMQLVHAVLICEVPSSVLHRSFYHCLCNSNCELKILISVHRFVFSEYVGFSCNCIHYCVVKLKYESF
jgi:hypothetical protein